MNLAAQADRLYGEGRLLDAIDVLGATLRNDPTDQKSRMFLFELLCFSGSYERARKQLDALQTADPDAHLSIAWYHEALTAEERRQTMFRDHDYPDITADSKMVHGTLNGRRFADLRDADPRIGARLEAIIGGQYAWIPFRHLTSLRASAPAQLRDLFWMPASIEGSEELAHYEGAVLLPVLTPLAWQHADESVQLGRITEWQELEGLGEVPVGQKLWMVDDEEVPILEVRELIVDAP